MSLCQSKIGTLKSRRLNKISYCLFKKEESGPCFYYYNHAFFIVSDYGRIVIFSRISPGWSFSEQDGCLHFKILKFCLLTGGDDGGLSGTGSQEGGIGPGTPGRNTCVCLNNWLLFF
jgi:hypothetical protein